MVRNIVDAAGILFAVKNKRVFVRFDSDDNWMCRANTRTEDILKLIRKLLRSGQSSRGIVILPLAAPIGVALGKVVSHDDEAISSARNGVLDPVMHGHAQERPTKVKMTSDIPKWLDDAGRSHGDAREIKPAVHAFEGGDFSRVGLTVGGAAHPFRRITIQRALRAVTSNYLPVQFHGVLSPVYTASIMVQHEYINMKPNHVSKKVRLAPDKKER